MDVHEAAKIAIDYTKEMVGLVDPERGEDFLRSWDVVIEEAKYEATSNCWAITVGYVNPWDRIERGALATLAGSNSVTSHRTMKVVSVSDGTVKF